MGQAKRKGSLEYRIARAQQRNKTVEENLFKMPQEWRDYAQKHGVHRLGVVLEQAGIVKTEAKPKGCE